MLRKIGRNERKERRKKANILFTFLLILKTNKNRELKTVKSRKEGRED